MRFRCILALAALVSSCSDPAGEAGNGQTTDLGSDRERNVDGENVDAADDPIEDPVADAVVEVGEDGLSDSNDDGNPFLLCEDDEDEDGWVASRCGGRDCDDSDASRNPGLNEACDFLDNDCDQQLNNGITCTFWATTDLDLYAIDPFKETVERVASAPELWDIDTHPDGTLYGVSEVALYTYITATRSWVSVGDLDHSGGDANGMAIDLSGVAYLTAADLLYTIDLSNGRTQLVGAMGGGFESSGDCVVNKDNTLLMSSRHLEGTDSLIRINGGTGQGTDIGPVGIDRIYGLTAAWGYLFGLTSSGELISINESTGEGTLLRTFAGYRFFGAASTPSR